jgi:alanyl-tRNA synthetase
LTRIDFVAGTRALADYRKANRSAREVASLFSAGRDDSPQLAAQILEENKELHRRVRLLEDIAAEVEAQKLLSSADEIAPKGEPGGVVGGARLVTHLFDAREAESVKNLAQAIIESPGTIALLASRDKDTARLVFARSADTAGDMNALMREACAMLDGRGGGRPDLAQGGGKRVDRLTEVLAVMRSKLSA